MIKVISIFGYHITMYVIFYFEVFTNKLTDWFKIELETIWFEPFVYDQNEVFEESLIIIYRYTIVNLRFISIFKSFVSSIS